MPSLQEVLSSLHFINEIGKYTPGTPVMLEMWATWCPPCRAAIPHIAQLPAKYPNVYIVSASRENIDHVTQFASRMAPMKQYNVAAEPTGVLEQFMSEHSVNGIPHAMIFDAAGQLLWSGHPMDGECEEMLATVNAK